MELSCLFVNYNSWAYLAGALRSLARHPPRRPDGTVLDHEIVVVDNASPRPEPEARAEVEALVARRGGRVVDSPTNGGYAAGMNLAWSCASGRLVLACNPDLVFGPDAVTRLVDHFGRHDDIGAVAPAVFADEDFEVHLPIHVVPRPRELVWTLLGTLSRTWNRRCCRRRTRAALEVWGVRTPVDEPMFGGCCFLTSRTVLERVGFFDEGYPLYYEDTDLSHRMRRAGLRLVRVGDARVAHLYDRSAGTSRADALARLLVSRRRYFAKWHGLFGRIVLALTGRILGSRWGQARARRVAEQPARPLEWHDGRPVLRLPRQCDRFAVEIAFEPYLFLCAAAFGSGDTWSPGPAAARQLRREAWLRALDLSDGEPTELGRWHNLPRDGTP